MKIQSILVVCVGNICRSPMAEYFLKQQFPQLDIRSAGLSALVGQHADPKAILCMDQHQIDMRAHIAKQINTDEVKQADIIFVMSQNQKNHIEQAWPFARGKVFRLGHWQNENVADPYQHEQEFFNEICCRIQKFTLDWQSRLSV
mgnify:CR=1 FL=1